MSPSPIAPGPDEAIEACLHVLPRLRRPAQRLLLPNLLAITVGRHVFSWRPLEGPELAHELEHVRQWRRYGVRFIPRYVRASLAAVRTGGDRYRDNRFEIAARAAEERAGRT